MKTYILIVDNIPYCANSLFTLSYYLDILIINKDNQYQVYINGKELNNTYSNDFTEEEIRVDIMASKRFNQVINNAKLFRAELM